MATPKEKKDVWDILSSIGPIINGVIIVAFGYILSNSIEGAFKERQLQISGAQAMQGLLKPLMSDGTEFEQFKASAYALAAFGPGALTPLIKVIDHSDDYKERKTAAEAFLYASLGSSETACSLLKRVIGRHSTIFLWETHQEAIKLIGDLKCNGAMKEIESYWEFLQKIEWDSKDNLKQNSLEELRKVTRDEKLEEINKRGINDGLIKLCKVFENLTPLQKKNINEKEKCP